MADSVVGWIGVQRRRNRRSAIGQKNPVYLAGRPWMELIRIGYLSLQPSEGKRKKKSSSTLVRISPRKTAGTGGGEGSGT